MDFIPSLLLMNLSIVNYAHDYYLEDCIYADEDFYCELTVGIDFKGNSISTRVLKHIPVESKKRE